MSWWMRGLSATDDDILRRMFVISVSASGHFLWFLLCLERSCGRRVCLPVPTCGHAILCVSGKCRRQRQVSAIWSRRAQRATVCPLGQWPTLPHCCHLSRWRGCALPCASACACAPSSQTEATSGDSFLVHTWLWSRVTKNNKWPLDKDHHCSTYDAFSISEESYLIFVIFFTRAKFLENNIYTEKRQFFALNL